MVDISSPKISVIVPVYNAERWLRRCVDSILGQTFTDFELLLIDDGSKDASGAICDEYAARDSRIRVFHKPNGGVSSARNLGLDNARGEWVTFADSDDFTFPCWLENYNLDVAPKELDLVIQGVQTDLPLDDNQKDNNFYYVEIDSGPEETIEKLCAENIFGYIWIKCFRKKIIDNYQLRFDENLTYLEDEMWVMDFLVHAKKIKAYNKIGYFYYVPKWDSKYKQDNSAAFDLKFFEKASKENYEVLKRKYGKHYTESLTSNFINFDWSRRNLVITYIKDFISDNSRYCTIHPILKWLIYYIPFNSVSTLLYSFYKSLRG